LTPAVIDSPPGEGRRRRARGWYNNNSNNASAAGTTAAVSTTTPNGSDCGSGGSDGSGGNGAGQNGQDSNSNGSSNDDKTTHGHQQFKRRVGLWFAEEDAETGTLLCHGHESNGGSAGSAGFPPPSPKVGFGAKRALRNKLRVNYKVH
jgi:hypothetical protein